MYSISPPSASRLSQWTKGADLPRRSSYDSTTDTDSIHSNNNSYAPYSHSPLSSFHSHFHSDLHFQQESIGMHNTTKNTTLAQLFKEQWDPGFFAYINRLKPSTFGDDRKLIPYNQLPTPANNYSVSNYTLELMLSIGIRGGKQQAEKALSELLANIPPVERVSYSNRLIQRAQQLMKKKRQQPLCAFCRNNGQPASVFGTHILKDDFGRVRCPVLRAYCCPRCGAKGDNAHTITYCPLIRRDEMCHRLYNVTSATCSPDYLASLLSTACNIERF